MYSRTPIQCIDWFSRGIASNRICHDAGVLQHNAPAHADRGSPDQQEVDGHRTRRSNGKFPLNDEDRIPDRWMAFLDRLVFEAPSALWEARSWLCRSRNSQLKLMGQLSPRSFYVQVPGLFFVLSKLVAKVDGCFMIYQQKSLNSAKCERYVDEMTSNFVGSWRKPHGKNLQILDWSNYYWRPNDVWPK